MSITGWIWIFGLWYLFFWLYRDYRLDLFRQHLFALRDELFDLGAARKIGFDSAAYRMLRSTINGNIQFGHRLGFLDALCFLLFTRGIQSCEVDQYCKKWEDAVAELDPATQKAIQSIRARMYVRIAEQIICTSAVLVLSLATVFLEVLMIWLKRKIARILDQLFSKPRIQRLLDAFDCAVAAK